MIPALLIKLALIGAGASAIAVMLLMPLETVTTTPTINVTFDVGSILTGLGVVMTAFLSWLGYRQSKLTHTSTNSKMDQLFSLTGTAEFAKGKLAGTTGVDPPAPPAVTR